MEAVGVVVALALSLGSVLLLVPLRWPSGSWLLGPKLLVAALAPVVALVAVALAVGGIVAGLPMVVVPGGLAAATAGVVCLRIVTARPVRSGAAAGGAGTPEPQEGSIGRRGLRRHETAGQPSWQRDVPVVVVPGTGRVVLGDLWSPPSGTVPSGLAIVYLHGSAWYVLDKDLGTRRLFRQLAGQGHVVLDLAYRLLEHDVTTCLGCAHAANNENGRGESCTLMRPPPPRALGMQRPRGDDDQACCQQAVDQRLPSSSRLVSKDDDEDTIGM